MAVISKEAVLREVVKRQTAPVQNKVELKGDFPQQDAFINDPERFIDVQCSRRSGKTTGLAIRFLSTMDKYPKSQCLYLSLTQTSARNIMWGIMQELDEKHKIGCTFLDSKLEIIHPNGAKLRLMGADLKDYRRKLKGSKFPGCAIDEAQDFRSDQLQSLINDVLAPSIADYADGWIAVTGTPGPVPQGYFFDLTCNRKFGFSHHEWTMLDNPHMPDPEARIREVIEKNGWTPDNPTLLREWRNQWVLDVDALWIRYKESVNHYEELPQHEKFNYIMGIDIGFRDADALCIVAYSPTSPITYLVEEVITTKQDITSLAEQIKGLNDKYKVERMVIDAGALGKKIAEELISRHSLPVVAAEKQRKQENVEFLNDALRQGKFKANKDSRFATDSYLVQIDWAKSTPDRIHVKDTPHSDIIDSVLYAFKLSYAYAAQPAKKKLIPGSPEWLEAQGTEMWENAQNHFKTKEEDAELARYNGFDE